jgi:hypothetical protein
MAFRGVEANIELAKYGLVGTRNLAAVPVTALLQARNISLDTGAITRAGGSRAYNLGGADSFIELEGSTDLLLQEDGASFILLETLGEPLPAGITGLWDWFPTTDAQRLIAGLNNGEIYRDATGDGVFVLAKTGLDPDSIYVFAEGGAETIGDPRKLFIATGFDTVQVFEADDATTRDIGPDAPTDWTGADQPRSVFFHNGRMWGVLEHLLYGSTVTDHEDFTNSGSVIIPVQTGEGAYLQGGISFKGRLFVFKWPTGIYWLDDSSSTQANWQMKRLTRSTGLASPNAMCQIDDDILFVSEIGHIHMLSGIQDFGDVQNSDLSALNELTSYIRDNVDISKDALERVWGIYYPEKKQARFAMRSLGATQNDIVFIVDINRKDTPRIHVDDKDEPDALAIRQDENRVSRPISGDNDGVVWLLDQDHTSIFRGSAEGEDHLHVTNYVSEFQIPHTDFAWFHEKLGAVRKNYSYLEAIMQPTGNFTLTFDILYDGVIRDVITMNTGESGAALGSFVIGQDQLGGDTLLNTRKRLRGSSRRLSLIGRQDGEDEKFTLSQLTIGLTPGSA